MRSKAQSKNRFVRIISTPYRVLIKARDFYVHSMTNCAGRVSYGGATPGELPRSFSTASTARSEDTEDFRELLRAASVRSLGNDSQSRLELEILLQQQSARQSARVDLGSKGVMRSVSVGMGRIDEDIPCDDFDEGGVAPKVKTNILLYPRSKSYAVTNKTLVI